MWTLKNILAMAGISLGTFVVGTVAKYGLDKAAGAVAKKREESEKKKRQG